MLKSILLLVICFLPFSGFSLSPIEGVIFGNVKDIKQYDPLRELLSDNFTRNINNKSLDYKALKYINALYRQGIELENKCEISQAYQYPNVLKEALAKRSIVSNLQYIGLDKTIKSLTQYAQKLEWKESEFRKFTKNLIKDTCHPNTTVYSLKLMQDSFLNYWKSKNINHRLPIIENNVFYSPEIQKTGRSLKTIKRQFEYSIRNFRALCSWDGDPDSLGLLVPYLKNPFLMSIVSNHFTKTRIGIDEKTQEFQIVYDKNASQVACENMICRKRNEVEFKKLYPRMIGSTKLRDDFEALYCNAFKRARYDRLYSHEKIKKWISSQTESESKIEVMHLISQFTGLPALLLNVDRYNEMLSLFKNSIKYKWNSWARNKNSQLFIDQLYEEPLVIKVRPYREVALDFKVDFDIVLSELDQSINKIDKIQAMFKLKFPKSYIAQIKKTVAFEFNRGNYKKAQEIEKEFTYRVVSQIQKKSKFFRIKIWNERLGEIVASELLDQINRYRGKQYQLLSKGFIEIPVRFHYGLFALHYISKKFDYKINNLESLTFK